MALSSIFITAPSSAQEGDQVSVSATVKNISVNFEVFRVKIYANLELLGTFEDMILSMFDRTFNVSFTMPADDITLAVVVYQFTNVWNFDNQSIKFIELGVSEAPPPEEYPPTDIKNIAISVLEMEYPSTDIRNITINVLGVAYPSTDIRNITINVLGVEYPSTDIRNISIEVVEIPVTPPPPGEEEEEEEEEEKFPWVPAVLIGGGVAGLVVGSSIGAKKSKGG